VVEPPESWASVFDVLLCHDYCLGNLRTPRIARTLWDIRAELASRVAGVSRASSWSRRGGGYRSATRRRGRPLQALGKASPSEYHEMGSLGYRDGNLQAFQGAASPESPRDDASAGTE